MTEQEKFRKTFAKLHASPDVLTEVLKMTEEKKTVVRNKRFALRIAAAAAAALILAVGCAGAAYAMDLGGIRQMVQVWLHGEKTEAVLSGENGSYLLEYTDADGKVSQMGGGGVAMEDDGTERPLTGEEFLEGLDFPEVEYKKDGSVWVYYRDQAVEITDKFEDGVCYLTLNGDEGPIYMTVMYQDGFMTSPDGYLKP